MSKHIPNFGKKERHGRDLERLEGRLMKSSKEARELAHKEPLAQCGAGGMNLTRNSIKFYSEISSKISMILTVNHLGISKIYRNSLFSLGANG